MAYKPETWEQAKALFEAGRTLAVISERTGITKGQISKKAANEGWSKNGKMGQAIALGVEAAKAKILHEEYKEIMTPVERRICEIVTEEQVRGLPVILKGAAYFAQEAIRRYQANPTMDNVVKGMTAIEKGARVLMPTKENAPQTAIQINNQQQNRIKAEMLSDDDLARIAQGG